MDPRSRLPREDIVRTVRRLVPDFARRPLSWDDFSGFCSREGIDVAFHEGEPDERLLRGDDRSRISLQRRLAPTYRLFIAWHAVGHYVLHPGPATYYFERGRMDLVETEASFVGLLALTPWVTGPPYPQLRGVVAEEAAVVFHMHYPDPRPDGKVDWRALRITMARFPGGVAEEGCHGVADATLCRPSAWWKPQAPSARRRVAG